MIAPYISGRQQCQKPKRQFYNENVVLRERYKMLKPPIVNSLTNICCSCLHLAFIHRRSLSDISSQFMCHSGTTVTVP